MQARGQKIKVHLYMEGHILPKRGKSHNIVGEITGSKYPEQVILIGGHIDSWDTGPQTGANDDAAGFFVCYEAVRILLDLGIRPKRTIKFIAWAGDEFGGKYKGALQYEKAHRSEMPNYVVGFESDYGTTLLEGFNISGNDKANSIVRQLMKKYLPNLKFETGDGEMADSEVLFEKHGIPVIRNIVKDTPDSAYYFAYHHSAGDTVSVLDKDDLDSNVLGIASLFYLIADSDETLPKRVK